MKFGKHYFRPDEAAWSESVQADGVSRERGSPGLIIDEQVAGGL